MIDQTLQVPTFSEAPTSWNVKYISADGFDCQLTLRSMDAKDLFHRVELALEWLAKNGATSTRGHSPALVNTPPPSAGPAQSAPKAAIPTPVVDELIKVGNIAHAVTTTGHHYVNVKGGKYSKFGVKAWGEVLPPAAIEFETWPIGAEYAPLEGMDYAIVRENKVTSFRATAE